MLGALRSCPLASQAWLTACDGANTIIPDSEESSITTKTNHKYKKGKPSQATVCTQTVLTTLIVKQEWVLTIVYILLV